MGLDRDDDQGEDAKTERGDAGSDGGDGLELAGGLGRGGHEKYLPQPRAAVNNFFCLYVDLFSRLVSGAEIGVVKRDSPVSPSYSNETK